jgi:hypothetical protein
VYFLKKWIKSFFQNLVLKLFELCSRNSVTRNVDEANLISFICLKLLFSLKCDIERFLIPQVYQGEEKEFHQLHEQIIRNNKCSPLPGQPNYGIVVSLRILHGELSQVREENPLLFKNICLTKNCDCNFRVASPLHPLAPPSSSFLPFQLSLGGGRWPRMGIDEEIKNMTLPAT